MWAGLGNKASCDSLNIRKPLPPTSGRCGFFNRISLNAEMYIHIDRCLTKLPTLASKCTKAVATIWIWNRIEIITDKNNNNDKNKNMNYNNHTNHNSNSKNNNNNNNNKNNNNNNKNNNNSSNNTNHNSHNDNVAYYIEAPTVRGSLGSTGLEKREAPSTICGSERRARARVARAKST